MRRDRQRGDNTIPSAAGWAVGALAKGLYRAAITATGANEKRSQARHARFRIVSR